MIPFLIAALFLPCSLKNEEPQPPVTDLRIDQEKFCTDKNGIANPIAIINLRVGENIKIYLIDGTCLCGVVNSVEMIDGKIFKVFGDIKNQKNTGFGFILAKEGQFAGAILMRDEDKVYTLEYNETAKGYAFFLSSLKNKA